MPVINFEYEGQKFKATVPGEFNELPEEEKKNRLYDSLFATYGREDTPSKEDKNILDYVALLERPIQALKVGAKESVIGGAIYRSKYNPLGGVDLTPSEGFLTGAGRGWMGNDELRFQDTLPENMNPALKTVLGFAGDVVSDPLTWWGPAAVRGAGGLIKGAGEFTGATPVLKKGRDAIMSKTFGEGQYGLPDVLRHLNVATGKGEHVKGAALQSSASQTARLLEERISRDIPDLNAYFDTRARTTDYDIDTLKQTFREAMERDAEVEYVFKKSFDPKTKRPIKWDQNKFGKDDTYREVNGFVEEKVPLLDDATKTPITFDDGSPIYQVEKRTYVGFTDDQKRILGKQGTGENGLVQMWNDTFDDVADLSAALGMPIRTIQTKGYFPRVITGQAADKLKYLKETDIDEAAEELLKPIFGANYKVAREAIARGMPVDEASLLYGDNLAELIRKRQADLGHTTKNPIDLEFDYFQLDPGVAMGIRLQTQQRVLQKKWFLDEITDSSRQLGPTRISPAALQAQIDKWVKEKSFYPKQNGEWNKKFVEKVYGEEQLKLPNKIGVWFRKTSDDKWEKREYNDAWIGLDTETGPQFRWVPADTSEVMQYQQVKGVPKGYVPFEEIDETFATALNRQAKELNLDSRVIPFIQNLKGDRVAQADKALEEAMSTGSIGATFTKENLKKTIRSWETAIRNADAEVNRLIEKSSSTFWAPRQVARQIEDTLSVMGGVKRPYPFLKWYDKIQNGWKAWTLGVRPAYHTRNVIGNLWNAYLATGLGENPIEAAKTFYLAGKLQYYSRFNGDPLLRQRLIDNMTGLKAKIHDLPSINSRDWTADNFAGTGYTMRELAEAAKMRGITAGHYTKDHIRDLEIALEAQAKTGSRLERILGPENPAVRYGFGIGGTMEGNARFGVFLHVLKEIKRNPSKYDWVAPDGKKYNLGKKAPDGYFKTVVDEADTSFANNIPINKDDMIWDAASREVKGALFDYSDLSSFEQNVLKRFLPFYTWSRKNIPLQIKHLVLNPQRAEKLAIAKQNFEHETGELDVTDYGKFWGDRVPVFFGNESEGVVKAFTLLNLLPMADLQRVLPGGGPAALAGDLFTPMLKTPFEILVNYDTFRKSPIKKHPGETQDFLGIALPPRLHHLAKVLVPLTEINRTNPMGVFGERQLDPVTGVPIKQTEAYFGLGARRDYYADVEESARWLRFFSGVARYDINLKRNRYFMNKNVKKDLAELKGKLKWALRKGRNRTAEEILALIESVQRQETTDPYERR